MPSLSFSQSKHFIALYSLTGSSYKSVISSFLQVYKTSHTHTFTVQNQHYLHTTHTHTRSLSPIQPRTQTNPPGFWHDRYAATNNPNKPLICIIFFSPDDVKRKKRWDNVTLFTRRRVNWIYPNVDTLSKTLYIPRSVSGIPRINRYLF